MKNWSLSLLVSTLLASTFCVYAPIMVAFPIILNSAFGETNEGVLKIENFVDAQVGSNYVQVTTTSTVY
jgi:hypothetical protein